MQNHLCRNGILRVLGVLGLTAATFVNGLAEPGSRALNASVKDATISTTLTVTNATGSLLDGKFSGQATLTNIGNGTFAGTLNLASISQVNLSATFTITLTTGDQINGTLTIPSTSLTGPLTGSAAITGGTNAYAGATGSFSSLTGSLNLVPSTTLSFSGAGSITTSGGGSTGPVPTISAVLDAGSYTSSIAQGSIFVVKGTTLSASGYTAMSFPLPTTSGNVKITFTPLNGGAGTDAYLVYLYNVGDVNQLAALLPASVQPGTYNVTVTNNGQTSGPASVRVVQRKLGLITADSTGSGLAVVQNYVSASQLDIDRFTTFSASGFTFSPAKPGQTLIAWATGMGPVPGGSDNTASPGYDFSNNGVNVQVIVGNKTITPLYAGRTPGLAGTDQINFTLPADVQTGCTVPFQISVNGSLSNPSFLAIAPNTSSNACSEPGFTAAELQQWDQGKTVTTGGFNLSSLAVSAPGQTFKSNSASGAFTKYTGFQLSGYEGYRAQTSTQGTCTVVHTTSSSATAVTGTGLGLDAGQVTLSGPSGSNLNNVNLPQVGNNKSYFLSLGTDPSFGGGASYPLVAGTYTLNGNGGKDVGKFNASVTIGTPLTLTGGLPNTVVRSAGLTLNWTGGNPSDPVWISGSSAKNTGTPTSPVYDSWSFVCSTNAGAKTFTVPASILTQLPAVSGTTQDGSSSLAVFSGVFSNFTAPLTAGGNVDTAVFVSQVGSANSPAYQ